MIQIWNYFLDIEDDEEDDDAAVVEGGTTTSPKMITGVVMNGLSSGVGLQDGNEGKEEGADPAEQTKKKMGFWTPTWRRWTGQERCWRWARWRQSLGRAERVAYAGVAATVRGQ